MKPPRASTVELLPSSCLPAPVSRPPQTRQACTTPTQPSAHQTHRSHSVRPCTTTTHRIALPSPSRSRLLPSLIPSLLPSSPLPDSRASHRRTHDESIASIDRTAHHHMSHPYPAAPLSPALPPFLPVPCAYRTHSPLPRTHPSHPTLSYPTILSVLQSKTLPWTPPRTHTVPHRTVHPLHA